MVETEPSYLEIYRNKTVFAAKKGLPAGEVLKIFMKGGVEQSVPAIERQSYALGGALFGIFFEGDAQLLLSLYAVDDHIDA